MKTAFNRSYRNVNRLNPALSQPKKHSTLSLVRYVCSSNLVDLPRRLSPLRLRLLIGMVLRIPLCLRYIRILCSSYAASATISWGRIRGLPRRPVLILMQPDIEASNGVIHVIDKVLMPK